MHDNIFRYGFFLCDNDGMLQAVLTPGFGRSTLGGMPCDSQSYQVSPGAIPFLVQMVQQHGMTVSGGGNNYQIDPHQHSIIINASYNPGAQSLTLTLTGGDSAVTGYVAATCSQIWNALNGAFGPLLQQAQAMAAQQAASQPAAPTAPTDNSDGTPPWYTVGPPSNLSPSDACDNDPNCHGSTDGNGNLISSTCDGPTTDPALSASPCFQGGAPGPGAVTPFATTTGGAPTAALTAASAWLKPPMVYGVAALGVLAIGAVAYTYKKRRQAR